MAKPLDASFFLSAFFVILAVALAFAAVVNPSLPVVGSGRWALLAVAAIGMVGCSLGGLSQVPVLGWTHPFIVVGSVLGVAALGIIAAGLLDWDAVLRPVAQALPGQVAAGASTQQLAIVVLAILIAIKWAIGVAFAVTRTSAFA
jgi:hypothetical protein